MSNPEHPRITEVGRLLAENDRLREALEHIAAGDFAELAAENDRLREALKSYQNDHQNDGLREALIEIIADYGDNHAVADIARAALAKEAGQP